MIATIDVEVQAASPNMPLFPWRAFRGSPSSVRVRNVPKRIGLWSVAAVQVSVTYPNDAVKSAECRLVGGVWIGTVEASETAGTVENGYSVTADGTDENGNEVKGYILGRGDVEIIETDSIPLPFEALGDRVHVYASKPETLHEGDLWHDSLDKCWHVFLDGKEAVISLDEGRIEYLAGRIANAHVDAFGNTVYTKEECGSRFAVKTRGGDGTTRLGDNVCETIDSPEAGGEVAVSFADAEGDSFRFCELIIGYVPSDGAVTLSLPAGRYHFASGADSVSEGVNHFCFAECGRNVWIVTKTLVAEPA